MSYIPSADEDRAVLNINRTHPYKTPAPMPLVKLSPPHGLIRATKRHRCNPPGLLKRWLNWLMGRKIRKGSLYRCEKCLLVRSLCKGYSDLVCFWAPMSSSAWEDAAEKLEEP